MNEMIQQIREKAELNEEQATKAAEAAISFIKERLPENLHGQLDKVVGSGGVSGTMGDLTRKAGSVLDKE